MILDLEGTMSDKMFLSLKKAIQTCPKDEVLTIYFSTTGGAYMIAMLMLDLLKIRNSFISLKAYNNIDSAGFLFFFRAMASLERKPNNSFSFIAPTNAIVHLATTRVPIKGSDNKNNYYYKQDLNINAEINKEILMFLSCLPISTKTFAEIEKGGDVFLDYTQLQLIYDAILKPTFHTKPII